jgi:hypothetical protein
LDNNAPPELTGPQNSDKITADQQSTNLTNGATAWKKLPDLQTAQASADTGRIVLAVGPAKATGIAVQIALLFPVLPQDQTAPNKPANPQFACVIATGAQPPNAVKQSASLSDAFSDPSKVTYFRYRL